MSNPSKLDLSGLDNFSTLMNQGGKAVAEAGKPLSLPLDRVDEDPRNARKKYDAAKMEELAESIRADGLTSPIVVKIHPDDPKRYRIMHGHRRYRAHKMIEAATIEAIITDRQDSASQLVDNLQREDLTTAETVAGIKGLLEDGFKQSEIATRLGKSKTWISRYAALTDLPPELQDLLDNERCRDASTLYEALQCFKQDADAVRTFLANSGDRQIVQADVENLRMAIKRGTQPAQEPTPEAGASAAEPSSDTSPDASGDGKTLAQVFSGAEQNESDDDQDPAPTPLAQTFANEKAKEAAAANDQVGSDEGEDSERKQNVKPASPTPDPTKVRKPLVQIRVGRREGVLLIAKKATYGLAWVEYEDGTQDEIDINKVKLVAVTDGAK